MALSLTDIAKTAKSELVLIFLGIVCVSLLAFTIYSFINKTPVQKPQQQGINTAWNGLSPGVSTKNDVLTSLGNPKEMKKEGNIESLLYSSASEFRPHEVQISQGTARLIKEQVVESREGAINEFIRKYGKPEAIIYGHHGFIAPAHFWGSKGVIAFAGTTDGVLVEIWYFQPQTLSSFLEQFPNFTTEPAQRHESY